MMKNLQYTFFNPYSYNSRMDSKKDLKKEAPANFIEIDEVISRSAQPTKGNIDWLSEQNVTDIINFRRDDEFLPVNFDEKKYVESKKMIYHNIPTYTNYPEEKKVGEFLNIIENVKNKGGKVHIHCREGADRTGVYSYIYERLNNLISKKVAFRNMVNGGWHFEDHPHLAKVAEQIYKKIR